MNRYYWTVAYVWLIKYLNIYFPTVIKCHLIPSVSAAAACSWTQESSACLASAGVNKSSSSRQTRGKSLLTVSRCLCCSFSSDCEQGVSTWNQVLEAVSSEYVFIRAESSRVRLSSPTMKPSNHHSFHVAFPHLWLPDNLLTFSFHHLTSPFCPPPPPSALTVQIFQWRLAHLISTSITENSRNDGPPLIKDLFYRIYHWYHVFLNPHIQGLQINPWFIVMCKTFKPPLF